MPGSVSRRATSKVSIFSLLVCLAVSALALDTSRLKPTGYVNDFAGVIDAQSKRTLEEYGTKLERAAGAQLAIVTVKSLEDEPVEEVANRLFREWGVGKAANEGLLVLLSIDDHKSRAEVGYGLEPIITDGQAGSVLRDVRPILRQGDYGGALLAAAQRYGSAIARAKGVELDDLPEIRRTRDEVNIPFPLILLGFFFLMWLMSRAGGGGRRGGGGGGGVLPWIIMDSMNRRGGSSGGWSGGGFGGWSGGGSSGGFGGFGGGDSGGGGASSDW